MNTRPGPQTSEFWLTVATLAAIVTVALIRPEIAGEVAPYAAGLAGLYGAARSYVKSR